MSKVILFDTDPMDQYLLPPKQNINNQCIDARKLFDKITQNHGSYQESPQSVLLIPQTPSPLMKNLQEPLEIFDFEEQIFNQQNDENIEFDLCGNDNKQDIYDNEKFQVDQQILRHLKNLWDQK